jgi:colanic acid biosynthesis glycosyl transferase WcaI
VTQTKLRLTIIGLNYSPEPTGNAPYTTSLAQRLQAAGHTVRVITGYPHYPEWQIGEGYTGWSRSESLNGVELKRLRHYVPTSPGTLNRIHMELSFGIRAMFAQWGQPDVILLVSPALFSSGLAMLRAKVSPARPAVGVWVQDIYSRGVVETGMGGRRLGDLVGSIESLILRSADGVVAIHERFRNFLVNSLKVRSSDVRVIRNWTHLPDSPTCDRVEMRDSLGWAPNDLIVLHAGNMGKKQGLENVVAAARVAQEKGSRVKFVLMGDGNQRKSLEAMARGASNICFVDPLASEDFARALSAADFLLVNELPGVKDMAVPSKLTSYFNAGVPVIAATDEGSVTAAEIEASGGGVRVNSSDPIALVEVAEELGKDVSKASRLGAQGLRFRNETLSEETAVGHYDDFIKSLATSRGR